MNQVFKKNFKECGKYIAETKHKLKHVTLTQGQSNGWREK